jgi:hypothetical protein
MAKRRTAIDEPEAAGAGPHADGSDHSGETLEQRVHRLEDAVAALQDTHIMEERITEQVIGRVGRPAGPAATGIIDANQHPAAAQAPDGTAPAEAPAAAPAPEPPPRSWAFVETFRDIRTAFRMFFDHRYRASWSAYLALMILAYVLVSQWLWTLWGVVPLIGLLAGPMHLTFIGTILDKAVGLVLALFAFKLLHRELRRYREVSAVYPPYQDY